MDPGKILCFIPVGGQAKRMRPLTHDTSKPCVRLLNRPLIEFSLATLAKQGIKNFIFGEYGYTNYSDLFDQYGEGVGFSAKYQIEPRVHIKHQPNLDDVGSADSYRLNIDYYDVRNPVLVVQGDNLFNIDLADLMKKHEERNALMTIALTKVDKVDQYGIAELDAHGRIKRFVEKPSAENAPSNLANAGIYLLSPEARKIVQSDEIRKITQKNARLDFGFDLIPYLVNNGYRVFGYEISEWYDIGNPECYLKAMHDLLYGKLSIGITEERILPDRNIWIQGYSDESIRRRKETIRRLSENRLTLEGAALIGRHTSIGDFARISDSNIDNFCIIGEHANIESSAIMDAAKIGNYANISDSIIGRKVIVESTDENVTSIESTSVVGNAVHIREGCRLINTKVSPNLTIPPGMVFKDKFLQTYEDIARLSS
jgi:mannose-1-phosphate guanylyltransferase / phosphomannomutase